MPTFARPRRTPLALVVLAALVGATACQATEPEASPGVDALAYLNALAAGDAAAANALTRAANADQLPADDSLEGAEPITGVEVGEIEDVGSHVDYVDVPVAYDLGGDHYETTIELGREGERWLVTDGLEHDYVVGWTGYASQSAVNWSDLTSVALGSTVMIEPPAEAALLYPGVYEVVTDLGPYAVLSSPTVAVAPPSTPVYLALTVELPVAPSEETLAEVTTVLEENLEVELNRGEGKQPPLYTGFSSEEMMAVWSEIMAAESEGATFTASVVTPVEVTWEPGDGIWPIGHATILLSWTGPSGSGEHELTLATESTWAEATLESLEVTPGLWHVQD